MYRWTKRSPLLLACLLIAICSGIPGSLAENTPILLVSISGNTSVITMEANDTYILTLNEVLPNATIDDTNGNTTTIPLEKGVPAKTGSAAIILSSPSGEETVSLVKIIEPGYSAENQTFSCHLTPERYYEGTLLSEYANTSGEVQPGTYAFTHMVLETPVKISENDEECGVIDGVEMCDPEQYKRTVPLSGPGCMGELINGEFTYHC